MPKARMSARMRPSPWGEHELDVEVVANDGSLVIHDGQRHTTLASKDLSGTAGLGVFHLTSPQLPGQIELDVLDRSGRTSREQSNQQLVWLEELGFRDVLAALDEAGARVTLTGQAELARKGHTVTTWVAAPLLALCEGVLVAVGGDVIGRAIGGHLAASAGTSAVIAALTLVAVASGVLAWPYRALHPSTGSMRSAIAHLDAIVLRPQRQMGAVRAAAFPFVFAESKTPDGTAYFSVLPWQPRWRLPVLAVCAAVCAVATATDSTLDDGMAGGWLGGIGRLGTVVLVLVMYYLPNSGPVEVSRETALRVRKLRGLMYAAFLASGIAALVIGN